VGALLRDLRGRGAVRDRVWALFEQQPAWVFTFPNNTNDAIFHLVGAALFAAVALIQIGRDRA